MTGFHSKAIYFFTNCFFVILSLSRVGRYICLVKGKNGIQPFPASGSPTAGFSLSIKCERRQRVAALLYPKSFPPKQKDTFCRCPFVLAEAKGFEPLWACTQTVFKTASL